MFVLALPMLSTSKLKVIESIGLFTKNEVLLNRKTSLCNSIYNDMSSLRKQSNNKLSRGACVAQR